MKQPSYKPLQPECSALAINNPDDINIRVKATKAVILAAGLGSRMRKSDPTATVDPDQASVADSGVKALIPIGRPFLDYVLNVLADGGITDICLVIGPSHHELRRYYAEEVDAQRLRFSFAVQPEPRGTADALRAAQSFTGDNDFLMLNSDNYYPLEAIMALQRMDGSGLCGFGRDAMLRDGNVAEDRLQAFAAIEANDGFLRRVIEKPTDAVLRSLQDQGGVWLSMNCWRLGPHIFQACASIKPSSRGEYEIPDAVQYALDVQGVRFSVSQIDSGVLDLSSRTDIAGVKERLAETKVQL